MDQNRFDALTRSLIAAASRRTILGITLGGVLGLLGPGRDAAAAKKRRCRPKCGVCQRCQKGKCHQTKSGKKRCKRGKCQPRADGTECGGPCLACLGGVCTAKTGTACGAGTECLSNGSCARTCTVDAECGPGCFCSSNSLDGQRHCIPPTYSCDLGSCTTAADCAPGQHCQFSDCGLPARCVPLC